MGQLINFPRSKLLDIPERQVVRIAPADAVSDKRKPVSSNVLLFTGVRYQRLPEKLAKPKKAKPSMRNRS